MQKIRDGDDRVKEEVESRGSVEEWAIGELREGLKRGARDEDARELFGRGKGGRDGAGRELMEAVASELWSMKGHAGEGNKCWRGCWLI